MCPRRSSGEASWIRTFALDGQEREETPRDEEEDERGRHALGDREPEHQRLNPTPAAHECLRARLAKGRRDERTASAPRPQPRREDAERLGADIERLRGQERHEDVEVEAHEAHDRHDPDEDRSGERRGASPRRCPPGCRRRPASRAGRPGRSPPVGAQEPERREDGEEAEGVDHEAQSVPITAMSSPPLLAPSPRPR